MGISYRARQSIIGPLTRQFNSLRLLIVDLLSCSECWKSRQAMRPRQSGES